MPMFVSLPANVINKEKIAEIRGREGAHRISFAYAHKNQPKRSPAPNAGAFSLPFGETILPIFGEDTGLELYLGNSQGYWRSIKSEAEFTIIETWVKRQGTRHFLRDCLDLSVALDQNLIDNTSGQYTELGSLEARAKTTPDEDAISRLTARYVEAIRDLPFYRDAPYIAAVPPRPGKVYDLPSVLADRIAKELGITDLTSHFSFANGKGPIKELSLDKKWDAWEAAGLSFSPKLENRPSVILIDDKYQSGISIQYVASKLYWAGVGKVFGLCAVKTLGDDDNQ
jgi:hypothetical protein